MERSENSSGLNNDLEHKTYLDATVFSPARKKKKKTPWSESASELYRSRPTTFFLVVPGIEPGPPDL
jgi:hypothetical protein